jgi:hypothetical protein
MKASEAVDCGKKVGDAFAFLSSFFATFLVPVLRQEFVGAGACRTLPRQAPYAKPPASKQTKCLWKHRFDGALVWNGDRERGIPFIPDRQAVLLQDFVGPKSDKILVATYDSEKGSS